MVLPRSVQWFKSDEFKQKKTSNTTLRVDIRGPNPIEEHFDLDEFRLVQLRILCYHCHRWRCCATLVWFSKTSSSLFPPFFCLSMNKQNDSNSGRGKRRNLFELSLGFKMVDEDWEASISVKGVGGATTQLGNITWLVLMRTKSEEEKEGKGKVMGQCNHRTQRREGGSIRVRGRTREEKKESVEQCIKGLGQCVRNEQIYFLKVKTWVKLCWDAMIWFMSLFD